MCAPVRNDSCKLGSDIDQHKHAVGFPLVPLRLEGWKGERERMQEEKERESIQRRHYVVDLNGSINVGAITVGLSQNRCIVTCRMVRWLRWLGWLWSDGWLSILSSKLDVPPHRLPSLLSNPTGCCPRMYLLPRTRHNRSCHQTNWPPHRRLYYHFWYYVSNIL